MPRLLRETTDMNARPLFAALLACAAPLALAAPPSAAPSAGNWLQVENAKAPADTVPKLYQAQLLDWYGASGALSQDELDALPQADYFAFRPDLTRFTLDGPMAGQWTFSNPGHNRWPDNAVQVIDRSDDDHYRILARVYCAAGTAACQKLRAETAAMLPPEPATATSTASYAQWRGLVERETCTAGPKRVTPAPVYPTAMARRGEGGHVELQLLVNPCGEVRAVRLSESSGYPQLDQSAINAAWSWRLYSAREAEGALLKVPVDFVPPGETPPPKKNDKTSR